MLVYSTERFIKAHLDIDRSYFNHNYDRIARDAICGNCGYVIGEQSHYTHFRSKEFSFDDSHKNEWICCPKCGEPFYNTIETDKAFIKKEETHENK